MSTRITCGIQAGIFWKPISDRKFGHNNGSGVVDYYNADVVSATDYYPFGMVSRTANVSISGLNYRYGFNGKDNDNEVKGEGTQIDYGMRGYDPRLGRFLSVDPLLKKYAWYSPYQFAGNKPIWAADVDGMEEWMRTQEYLLRQKVQLHQQAARPIKGNAQNAFAQSLANQPTIAQADNSYYYRQRSDAFKADYEHNKAMYGAVMDPLAAK